jgi:hypothetical protein
LRAPPTAPPTIAINNSLLLPVLILSESLISTSTLTLTSE